MRVGWATKTLLGAAAVIALAGHSAAASDNVRPSSAPLLDLGVPFAGSWFGTPDAEDDRSARHWWRIGPVVRTGDSVQVAIDNSGSPYTLRPCLVAPTDDFGADDELRKCGSFFDGSISGGRQDRQTIRYSGPTGQPFLVLVTSRVDSPQEDSDSGGYSATIENIVSRVNIGAVPPRSVKRSFAYRATLRYGDNTPAADGTLGVLQWRRARGYSGPKAFRTLASASSIGGALRFAAKIPKRVTKRLQLRACVSQPGGTPRCTRATTVKVRSSRARAASARTLVPCYSFRSQEIGFLRKPRRCYFAVRGEDGGTSVNRVDVVSLRWRNWGSRKARARGTRVGGRGFRGRTNVILSGRRRCDGSDRIYTRATFRERGRVIFRIPLSTCPL